MIALLANYWLMFLLFAAGIATAIGIAIYAWPRTQNPNPDNLPPDSRVSEDEPRIWGNDN